MEKLLFCFFIRQIACQFIKTRAHNWKLSRSTKCCPNMKAMYFPCFLVLHLFPPLFLHLFCFLCMLFSHFTNLLHNEVTVISS